MFNKKHNRSMLCLPEAYNEKGSVWVSYLSTDEKYDRESGETPKKMAASRGRLCVIKFHFFWNANKSLGSLEKIRVDRKTGNTHIFFFCLSLGMQ